MEYLDFLVIDLPPGTGDVVPFSICAYFSAIVVTTPQKYLCKMQERLAMFKQLGVPCGNCRKYVSIYSARYAK